LLSWSLVAAFAVLSAALGSVAVMRLRMVFGSSPKTSLREDFQLAESPPERA